MKKEWIKDVYNKLFPRANEDNAKGFRKLIYNNESKNLEFSEGNKPFEDEEFKDLTIENTISISDDKKTKTRTFSSKVPGPVAPEPYRKDRFKVNFPGIPEYYFNSYKYLGHDSRAKKRGDDFYDYSEFKVVMFINTGIDICEKMVELEDNPYVGNLSIEMMDPTGMTLKEIELPSCEVYEIEAFRDLSYGGYKDDESDTVLHGYIRVRHKKRKFI